MKLSELKEQTAYKMLDASKRQWIDVFAETGGDSMKATMAAYKAKEPAAVASTSRRIMNLPDVSVVIDMLLDNEMPDAEGLAKIVLKIATNLRSPAAAVRAVEVYAGLRGIPIAGKVRAPSAPDAGDFDDLDDVLKDLDK